MVVFNTVTRKHCSVNGHVTPDGVKWDEDCNTCHCSNGKVVCTKVCLNKTSSAYVLNVEGEVFMMALYSCEAHDVIVTYGRRAKEHK